MPIDIHHAMIYMMVLASVSDRKIGDRELKIMGAIVENMPIFRGFAASKIAPISQECAELLESEEGIDAALGMVRAALPARLRDTAYAIACDVVAADGDATQEELRLLEMIRDRLDLDRLTAGAIERGAAARHRVIRSNEPIES